jgi:hypothetical protein
LFERDEQEQVPRRDAFENGKKLLRGRRVYIFLSNYDPIAFGSHRGGRLFAQASASVRADRYRVRSALGHFLVSSTKIDSQARQIIR